ncbi:hypothetical protein FACS1894198_3000 [Clostridia bacterium]|nr:hypothetical protein FACS1894198_3000 [Clostridia bacterium]
MLFEAYAMLLAQKLPIEQARKFLRISHTSLSAIVRHYVDKNVAADDLSSVSAICVDETSLKRGQSYVTVVGDSVNRRVIDVENGRGAEQVVEFSLKLEEKGGNCNKIMCATSDMSSAYLSAIQACFPKATRIIDKFHVSKLMRQAMNKVRHEEQGKLSKRKKAGRKLLMLPENNMTEEQRARANEICKQYPHTGRAFRMVQAFDTFYRSRDLNEAQEQFGKLISWLKRSRLKPMKHVAKTLVMHKDAILAYFLTRLTNAMAEGMNSLIQAGKRKARGFKTFKGYSTMIYLTCSKINFAPIPLFP